MKKQPSSKDIEKLKDSVEKKQSLIWDVIDSKEKKRVFEFCDEYRTFLSEVKTEREAVDFIVRQAINHGFVDINTGSRNSKKFYTIHKNKSVALWVQGSEPMDKGMRIIGSHMDSPRLDLKQNPLYEDVDLSLMKTHYYGGIKKYHWLARPLSLHGVVVLKNGDRVSVVIGEKEDDPVFCISDLLPHLAKAQAGKKLSEAFDGEKLNILVGSIPLGDSKIKERFKLAVLQHLNDHYSMTEEDFVSSEFELVPSGPARDLGFDRSLIGGYGQDDRVCVFTSLKAILETENPVHDALCLFFDKEEIGSEGNTGAKSRFFEDFISDIMEMKGMTSSERLLRKTLLNSSMLSGDVNAGIEPDYQDVHEKRNAAKLGYGICVTKFTGTGGKSGSSDASAEFMGMVRTIFNASNIQWQTGELGKIDQGGGGTIAKFLAVYGMDIIDCGPALLSMHSPFEISSKADIYMTYKAYKAFYTA